MMVDCRKSPPQMLCGRQQRTARKAGKAMSADRPVYIGTDSGATTSKVGGVWADGTAVSTRLLQRATNAGAGPVVVVHSWVEAITDYLAQNDLTWDQVRGVGLAIPGPLQRYGVLDRSANLPPEFAGFDIHTAYSNALANRAGRAVPLSVVNDAGPRGVAAAPSGPGPRPCTSMV